MRSREEKKGSNVSVRRESYKRERGKRCSPSREPSIGQASNIVTQSSSHDQTRWLQHLRHSRSSHWPEVPQNNDDLLSLLERSRLNGLDEVVLDVEGSSLSDEVKSLLSGDLRDGSSRSEVTSKDSTRDEEKESVEEVRER